jgi:hypothetical protein
MQKLYALPIPTETSPIRWSLSILQPLCALIKVYIFTGKNRGASELSSGFEGTVHDPASIATSLYFVMFAYSGW